MPLQDLVEDTPVMMTAPDGYTMRAHYVGYEPVCQRYEFLIKIGNGEGTKVYFPRAMIDKYTFVQDPYEAR